MSSSGDSSPPGRPSPPHQTRGHLCARREGERRPRPQPHRGSNCGQWRQDAHPTTHVLMHAHRPKRAPHVRLERRDASGKARRPQSMLAPPALLARPVRRPSPSSARPEGRGPYTRRAPPEIRTARTRSRDSSAAWARRPLPEYTLRVDCLGHESTDHAVSPACHRPLVMMGLSSSPNAGYSTPVAHRPRRAVCR